MAETETTPGRGRRRADAERNVAALLDAAATEFVRAGVGVATIYRHFPTRADLVVAVYRHQIDALARLGPDLLAADGSPSAALATWIDGFVDFLVTKHGLAGAL